MPESEKDYIKRIKEYAAYNNELDLWNNTLLGKLEREIGEGISMEKLDERKNYLN